MAAPRLTMTLSIGTDDSWAPTASTSSSSHSATTTTSLSSFSEEEPLFEYDLLESITGKCVSLQHPSLNFARVLVLAASAVYGTNFAMVKMLDEQIPFAVSAAMRFSLAAAVVTGLVLQGERKEPHYTKELEGERRSATLAGMEIGGWYCLGYLCQSVGLQTADASKSAFFSALAVIVVPLLDSMFRGKQMGPKGISSVALAIAGVGLLQLGPSFLSGSPLSVTHGDIFCLGQAVLFGIGYWRLEAISGKHSSQAGRVTVGQLGGIALGSTVFCGLTADVPTFAQLQTWFTDPFILGALGWTALISTALALYLETVALKAVSAAELTILMTSVSVFGSAFAYLTMGEVMSTIGMAGGATILAGCIVSSLGGGATTTTATADEDFELLVTAKSDSIPVLMATEDDACQHHYLDDDVWIPSSQLYFSNATTSAA